MNKKQIQNKDIMEIRKRLLGAFNFAKIPNQWRVTVWRKPPNPRRGTSFKRKPMRGRSTIGSAIRTGSRSTTGR